MSASSQESEDFVEEDMSASDEAMQGSGPDVRAINGPNFPPDYDSTARRSPFVQSNNKTIHHV
jgi:hypothetical protein